MSQTDKQPKIKHTNRHG